MRDSDVRAHCTLLAAAEHIKLLAKLLATFKMAASRLLFPRAKFLGRVAVSQLNSSHLSQLFGASFNKFASYASCSKISASVSDRSAINVKTSLVLNKYGVRNFSLQNWLGEYAILLLHRLNNEIMKGFVDRINPANQSADRNRKLPT